MERKLELATVFRGKKDVLCCHQEIARKTEKICLASLRPLYKGMATVRP